MIKNPLVLAVILSGLLLNAIGYAASPPNIVVVLYDDLGYGQPPSFAADSALRTPHFDRLVSQGMRFSDAHTAAAVCTPTRYGLLTGRYPSRIGQFGVLTTYSPPIIPASRLTIASLLKQHGYATACIGKWHLGMNWVDGKPGTEDQLPVGARMTDGPNAIGFDYFYGFTHARNIGSIIEQDRVVANVAAVANQPLMIQKALEWIGGRTADQPFFLYFPMCPPHTPIVPAPDYVGRSGATDLVKRDDKYGDWLYQGDDMLGQLMHSLEKHGFAENTLLIATSDNGAEGRAYAPLRGSKRSIYEGGHRVPFVARWPGKIAPATVSREVICLNDLMATAAEIVGAVLPDNSAEDSISILPALLGTPAQPIRASTVHQSMAGDLAIRTGNWKAVFHKDGRRELFQLDQDIGEERDLLAQHPEIAQQMTAALQELIDRGRSTPGAVQKNDATMAVDRSPIPGSSKKKSAQKRNKSQPIPQPEPADSL